MYSQVNEVLLSTKIHNDLLELKFSSRLISSIAKRIAIISMRWGAAHKGEYPEGAILIHGRVNPSIHSRQSNLSISVLQAMSCVYYGRLCFKNNIYELKVYITCFARLVICPVISRVTNFKRDAFPTFSNQLNYLLCAMFLTRAVCQDMHSQWDLLRKIKLDPILGAGASKMTAYDRSLEFNFLKHRVLKCTESLTLKGHMFS